MAQASINIRIDEDLKKDYENFCSDIGMNVTTSFTVYIKACLRMHKIPFELSSETDPFYSPENMERLRRSARQMELTGGTVHEVDYD